MISFGNRFLSSGAWGRSCDLSPPLPFFFSPFYVPKGKWRPDLESMGRPTSLFWHWPECITPLFLRLCGGRRHFVDVGPSALSPSALAEASQNSATIIIISILTATTSNRKFAWRKSIAFQGMVMWIVLAEGSRSKLLMVKSYRINFATLAGSSCLQKEPLSGRPSIRNIYSP